MSSMDLPVPKNYQYGIIIEAHRFINIDFDKILTDLEQKVSDQQCNLPVPLVIGMEKEKDFTNYRSSFLDFRYVNGLTLGDISSYRSLFFMKKDNDKSKIALFAMFDNVEQLSSKAIVRYLCAIDLSVCSDKTINEVIANHLKEQYDSLKSTNKNRADEFFVKYMDQPKGIEKVKEKGE